MPPLTRRLATVATAAGLLIGLTAASAAAQAPALAGRSADAGSGLCGASIANYSGTGDLDTPFSGTIDSDGATRPFWLVPESTAGDVRAWIYDEGTDSWTDSASPATAGKDYRGDATVWFDAPYGLAESDEVSCQGTADHPDRVVRIDGTVLHSRDHLDFFTLTRT